MKNIILITIFTFLTIGLNAQEKDSEYEGFKLGVKFGGNYDTSFGTDSFGASQGHFIYGAVFQIPIYRPLCLQVEALGTKAVAGYKLDDTRSSDLGTSWTLDYISLPTLIKFKFLEVFNVQYGIQYDYLIRAKLEVDNGYLNIEGLSKYDFSYVYGIGIDLDNGFFVDFRYVKGMRNIVKVPIDLYQSDIDYLRKSYFAISFGYRH